MWGVLKQDSSICISFSLRRRPYEAQECEQHRWVSWSHNLFASRLYLLLLYWTFVLVCLIPGFVLVMVFLFLLFRSRSRPAPHRVERTKQRTVLPQNIAIITSQHCLLCSGWKSQLVSFQSRIFYLADLFRNTCASTCDNSTADERVLIKFNHHYHYKSMHKFNLQSILIPWILFTQADLRKFQYFPRYIN